MDKVDLEKMGEELKQEQMMELLWKTSNVNLSLIWLAVTMATIAAINSLDGDSVFYKALVFMMIGLASLILYRRTYK